ncbi:MAG TPA: hypothetical protein VGH90_04190 [Chthoniobacteraceae bacterium]|jgi:hypothetical protein
MKTKYHLTLLWLLWLQPLRLLSADVADPAELIALRAKYEEQIQTATAPAETAFVNALETLEQRFTRSNQMDAAQSVHNELEQLKHEPTKPTTLPADPPELLERRAEHFHMVNRLQLQPLNAYLRELEPLKQQFLRNGALESAVAVDREIRVVTDRLKTAQNGSSVSAVPPPQILLESVIYGDPKTKRIKDVTDLVRTAFQADPATVTLGNKELQTGDPAPLTKKIAVFTYTVNGKRKEKTFPEGTVVDLKKELR